MMCLGIVMTVGNKLLVGIVPESVSNSIHGVKEVLPFLKYNHTTIQRKKLRPLSLLYLFLHHRQAISLQMYLRAHRPHTVTLAVLSGSCSAWLRLGYLAQC